LMNFLPLVDGGTAGRRCGKNELCVRKSLGQGSMAWDLSAQKFGAELLCIRAAAVEDDPSFFMLLKWWDDQRIGIDRRLGRLESIVLCHD